jgi:predicted AlkP superfamily pyrophosphatase or phosphodiesterase
VVPDYEGPCLAGVVPGIQAGPGRRPPWFPTVAADAAQVVLLVVDGLGWEQLRQRTATAPALAGMEGGAITSVAPTTTATALTSITFGRPPSAHGLVGYRFRVEGPTGGDEVLNVLRWRTGWPSPAARYRW